MKYFLVNSGQQQMGPFELNELLQHGLTPASHVWHEGLTGWVPATQVPEVAALLVSQSVPQQPPLQQDQGRSRTQWGYQQPGAQQWQGGGYGQPPYLRSMDLGDAIQVCFSKYFDFGGRARRSEFWWFQLFCYLLSMFTCGILSLVTFIPTLAVGARRLHDTGRSGWWQLLHLIPLVGIIVLIIWWCEDSHQGANEYGPSVKY